MVVRIKLKSKDEVFTMMFGNSYKNWEEQFREYSRAFKPLEIIRVETSSEKWIGWGGLKWCNEKEFQNELNREGCQDSDPDNPKPRIYDNMKFDLNAKVLQRAVKINERYL
jgi:hypothetical protein